MTYTPPIAEQHFVLETIARIDEIRALPGFEAATPDLVEAVLTEAGKLASGMFAPLNETGDRIGSKAIDGAVATPAGFRAAYDAYAEGGWIGLGAKPDHGGQGDLEQGGVFGGELAVEQGVRAVLLATADA